MLDVASWFDEEWIVIMEEKNAERSVMLQHGPPNRKWDDQAEAETANSLLVEEKSSYIEMHKNL